MKTYIALILISLVLFSYPKPSIKPLDSVCDKCGEHCIYQLGERAGLNEYQTETFLFQLQKF